MLTPPDRLSPAARDVFDRLAAQVASSNPTMPEQLLTDLLTAYSEAHAMRTLAMQQLVASGTLLSQSPNGVTYPSPALRIIDQCEKTQDRVLRRLGHGVGKADSPPFNLELDAD